MADEPAADRSKAGDLVPTVPKPTADHEATSAFLDAMRGADARGTGQAHAGAASAAAGVAWFGYLAPAALAVAVLGFGWAVGGYVYGGHQASQRASAAETALRVRAESDQHDLRKVTASMAADIKALKVSLDALRATGAHMPTQDEIRLLERNVDALKGKLDTAKTETNTALAQLAGKVDRAQADPAGKLHDMAERLERIEKQTAAPLTTASIPTPAVTVAPVPVPLPLPRGKVATLEAAAFPPAAESDTKKAPQLIAGWVVRDVYDGVALLEGPRGPYEVILGAVIPGVGTVKSIQRRGAGWIVLTNRGLVDYAHN